MSPDPIKDIEDRQTWLSFGRQAALIYQGATDEGLNKDDAMNAVAAFVKGMFAANYDNQKDDDSNTGRSSDEA